MTMLTEKLGPSGREAVSSLPPAEFQRTSTGPVLKSRPSTRTGVVLGPDCGESADPPFGPPTGVPITGWAVQAHATAPSMTMVAPTVAATKALARPVIVICRGTVVSPLRIVNTPPVGGTTIVKHAIAAVNEQYCSTSFSQDCRLPRPRYPSAIDPSGGVPSDHVTSDSISVLVADAQRMFSEALVRALYWCSDLRPIDEQPTTGTEAIEAITHHLPDVALLDYWMGGMAIGAPAVTQAINHSAPNCRVLVLSWLHGPQHIDSALQAGAVGFLPKSLGLDRVVEAIRRAHAGECPVFEGELEGLKRNIEQRSEDSDQMWERLRTLTRREVEILASLSAGLSVTEIAKKQMISLATVRNHIHKILGKTGARSQLEAVHVARHHKLIP